MIPLDMVLPLNLIDVSDIVMHTAEWSLSTPSSTTWQLRTRLWKAWETEMTSCMLGVQSSPNDTNVAYSLCWKKVCSTLSLCDIRWRVGWSLVCFFVRSHEGLAHFCIIPISDPNPRINVCGKDDITVSWSFA